MTTLGQVSLRADGTPIPIANRKSQALLAYLATTLNGRESRERVAGLLWSEFEEEKARASLRQTIADLRRAVAVHGPTVFSADRLTVCVDLTQLHVDCLAILRDLEAGEVPTVLLAEKRLPDSFLAGLDDIDPAFRAWLLVQRQILQERLLRELEDRLPGAADPRLAKRIGAAIVNLDPTHEVGCRAVIEASARLGDLGGALRAYRDLWDLLDQEFGMEPSPETQELIFKVKSGEFGDPKAAQAAAAPAPQPAVPASLPPLAGRGQAIVVTEFDTADIAPEQRGMIRAFRHELIASLVRFRDWSIIDGSEAVAQAQVPNAYRVDGTALPDESGPRFILTLKDSMDGRFVWSERFTIVEHGWRPAQQRIIRRIAGALDINLSTERLTQIAGSPELSLAHHDRWLRGHALSFQWRPDDEARAESIFRSLIEEAPSFAPAYASLVQILNSRHLVFPGISRTIERHEEALKFAKMAVQLDPLDTRAHLSLGWANAMSGNHEKAPVSYHLACDLNPNDPWTLVSSSLGFAYCGDADQAMATANMALDLGLGISRLHWAYQAGTRFVLGDYAGSIAAAENAGDVLYYLGGWKAAAHALVGDTEAARAEGARFVETVQAAWFGEPDPDETAIAQWLLHCFPIADRKVWEALRDGLAIAGLIRRGSATAPFPQSIRLLAAPDRVIRDA
ncbi:BTAD domain-containing putative transcriptional regulator [Inquilinus sp. NPDC058860]|uniref:BTAD domain-containing putative transcriptional regulator n=1 Tax=Inquilinus sp. NPDC058860 TaxID=3346652 RepID=UPI0036A06319